MYAVREPFEPAVRSRTATLTATSGSLESQISLNTVLQASDCILCISFTCPSSTPLRPFAVYVMYNRDPFALRRPSPLEIFRSGTRCAIDSAHSLQAQIKQETQSSPAPEQTFKDLEPSSVGGMSYAVNRTVPSEDTTWQPRRIHNTQPSGVSETVGNILASKNELPMYKDKPYNYAASKRKLPIYRRKRVLLLLFATIGCALYWVGVIPDTLHIKDRTRESGNGLFGLISGTKSGTVNWEERRARVRDAFTVSWNAYEKYAWGQSVHSIHSEYRLIGRL